jgi:hypothetical protein
MAWLVTEGRVLASCEPVTRRQAGLLGRRVEEAMVLTGCRWCTSHTIRPRRCLRRRAEHRREHPHAPLAGAPVWRPDRRRRRAFGRWVSGWAMSWKCADRASCLSPPRSAASAIFHHERPALQSSALILCEHAAANCARRYQWRPSGRLLRAPRSTQPRRITARRGRLSP